MAEIRRAERDDYLSPFDFFNRELEDFFRSIPFGVGITQRGEMDVYETEDDFVVECELPGLDKRDIKVKLDNDVLTISAEKRSSDEVKKGNIYRQERYFGKIERSIRLPEYIDKDDIQAKYENGVLKVIIPKKESAKGESKEISID
ncbi:Hsp20/alpha crystallin family protein [Petrotoga sp. 9PWA.NaAc.5.4]|uniref:Hsp20/alpha crystallin family protein n=1 Tax=Petrotoga sp. 9PWA.NaAc.5.4 TaxID=1434328 RepID=UPI000EFB8D23|nr:Hsp20/alpha crystallin family protein [Petrotoga sp. 9PWA.NaAc.5.4]